MDDLSVWCFHDPLSIATSELSRLGHNTTISNTGSICDNASLYLGEPIAPTNSNDWEKYANAWSKIDSVSVSLGGGGGAAYGANSYYCLGITPYINKHRQFPAVNVNNDGSLTTEAKEKMIVRCFRMTSRQPTIDQFPGKKPGCSEGVDEFGNKIPLV